MDREEAILVLTLERAAHRKDGLVERAIDMAIAALREQEQYDTLLKAFHDRLELDGLECEYCKHGGFECGTCPQTDEFAEHCEFWEWSGLGGADHDQS